MQDYHLTILIRCSSDYRVFDLLKSIDHTCVDIIFSITPDLGIESELKNRGLKYIISPKGNLAKTTLEGLKLVKTSKVLLVDSDCIFFPGSIERFIRLSSKEDIDIIRPNIIFEATNFSSYLTKIQRTFQYNCCGYVYEPGLFINLETTLPKVNGYLFSEYAPFTPDGELDFRIRYSEHTLSIIADSRPTILHRSLGFNDNLKSHWRYGYSDALITKKLRHDILQDFLFSLKKKYIGSLSVKYPYLTTVVSLISDCIYFISLIWHLIRLK